jgi:hypothetical protein
MNIETLRDLLLFIMINRVESNLHFAWYGGASSFNLYGSDKPGPQASRTDEIVAVRNDYVIVKVKGPNVSPDVSRRLHIIPISSILQIDSNFDFSGAR